MYTCPNCGREFNKQNQAHFCSNKPQTIADYIGQAQEEQQPDLRLVYQAIRQALPEAQEKISWSMPTFWKGHNLIHFAASKQHIGLYPGPAAVAHFQERLKDYHTAKGTIRLPYGKIDNQLVADIATWCWEKRDL